MGEIPPFLGSKVRACGSMNSRAPTRRSLSRPHNPLLFLIKKPNLPASLIPYVPAIAFAMALLSLCILGSAVADRFARTSRASDYLSFSRQWAEDWREHHRKVSGSISPWGGTYETNQDGCFGGTTLIISGFGEGGRAHCPEAEQAALQKAWDAAPIPGARLRFHFNGLPAVTLTSE